VTFLAGLIANIGNVLGLNLRVFGIFGAATVYNKYPENYEKYY
jgi:hypothetical protein